MKDLISILESLEECPNSDCITCKNALRTLKELLKDLKERSDKQSD